MVISGWWWDSMRLWDCLSVDKWDWTCRTVRGERGAQGEKSLLVSSSPHLHFSPNLNICTPNLVHLFLKSRWYTRIILMLILALALWPGVICWRNVLCWTINNATLEHPNIQTKKLWKATITNRGHDRSGSCLISIRQLPDLLWWLPDQSGTCLISIWRFPDQSGSAWLSDILISHG